MEFRVKSFFVPIVGGWYADKLKKKEYNTNIKMEVRGSNHERYHTWNNGDYRTAERIRSASGTARADGAGGCFAAESV
jgi:hypothetical protein